jgi:YVTN family beta-propeller protein
LAHHPHGAAAVIRIDLVHSVVGVVVDVSESATQLVMSPDGTEIYVVDRDGIAVISASTGRVFERITVDARPSCIALDSALSRLYVVDHAGQVTSLPAVTPVPLAAAR